MKKLLLLLPILSLAPYITNAQLSKEYRSKNNELYWGNRKPDAAYWQQDVNYKIDARIDEEKHIIEAEQQLTYWNNSPDTLTYVYFHLWQNAFVKGSHLHQLENANKEQYVLGKYEKEGLGTDVIGIMIGDQQLETELDNTILKVYLLQPLYPNSKVVFDIDFKTYWDDGGSTRRRMKMYNAWGAKHYNGVQWFPKICVYDRKFGWDTQQHLNKEFYGDFGTYEVSLDFPSNYVVEATGVLQNRAEVLPKELRAKLDVSNFKDKPWGERPSIITPYKKGERKVWKYAASNVHDFAFTADPSYRIDTTTWNGIECVGIVQEPHASGWQNSAEYVAKIIKTFSEDFGMYQYPKMVAADAADGMEYPMLTLDGGSDPGYRGLLVHEIGHNWFYGMVGNNETYRASLDEGFTQFITGWGLRVLEGDTMPNTKPKNKFTKAFFEPEYVLDRRVENAYVYDALNKNELPLNTHSNDFHDALGHEGGYRQVYYKTATMLYNLQYVLGDSLFQDAMQHYFHQWRFAHPYFDDFRTSIIQYTHVDLNWFFDQWIETTKSIDYGVKGIRKVSGTDSFEVEFVRNGLMQMPIDFTITKSDGTQQSYYIPNTWFEKQTNAITLPKWYGWSKLNKTYTAKINVPEGIKHVQIDTSWRLADIYTLDNYKTRNLPFSPKALKVKGDAGIANVWDRRQNRAYVRPDVWWNAVDGIKLGVHLEGDYFASMHKVSATVWWNTHFFQQYDYLSTESQGWYDKYTPISYKLSYESPLTRFMPDLDAVLDSRFLDGMWYHKGGFRWKVNDNNYVNLNAQTMWRNSGYDLDYLIYPNEWSSRRGNPNASLNASWAHLYHHKKGNGYFILSARAPFLTNGFNYSYIQLEEINHYNLDKLEIRTRLYGRYGMGTNIPYESALFASGANPEELMNNKYTRSVGFVPNSWQGISQYNTNHFQQGGGLNLRGYAGYFIADERDGQILLGYKSRSGASANVEVDFDKYIKLRPRLTRKWLSVDLYAFADAGIMELSQFASTANYWNTTPTNYWSDVRVDAGLGTAFTIKKWWFLSKAKPLTLRFDVPVFLNRPPYANPQYAAFRYVIGINRSF